MYINKKCTRLCVTDSGEVPDGDGAGFTAHDESSSVLQQFDGPNVVVTLLVIQPDIQAHNL